MLDGCCLNANSGELSIVFSVTQATLQIKHQMTNLWFRQCDLDIEGGKHDIPSSCWKYKTLWNNKEFA